MPPLHEAAELAARIREQVYGLRPCEPVSDLSLLLTVGEFDLSEADLGVHRGGHEALMFPGADGRLQIRVDPRPKDEWGTTSSELRDQTRRHRLRFRVAHEVAHSFFYQRGLHGARRRRRSTPGEERFCDTFAATFLLPDEAVATMRPVADSVLALHQRFDVSVEAAARRLAEVRPDLDLAVGFWPEVERCSPDNVRLQWATQRLGADRHALQVALCLDAVGWVHVSAARARAPRRQVVVVGRREDYC